jgi:Tfp pilus assembly protein PilO
MLNLNELKNVDIGTLFKSLLSNRTSIVKGPYAKVILWGLLGFLLFFSYVYFIFWPNLEQRQEMQRKVDAIPAMEAQLRQLDFSNQKAADDLRQSEKSYAELNQLFSVESELEELYQRLSMMAASQGMVISSLTKEGEEAIYAGGRQMPANGTNPAPAPTPTPSDQNAKAPQGAPLFYRIKLKVELTGQYGRYMRYRKMLSEFDKSINIDKEQITLVPNDNRGMVVVKSQLSTFRLPNKLNTKPNSGPQSNQSSVVPMMDSSNQLVNYFPDSGMHFIKVAAPASEEVVITPATGDAKLNGTQERDPFARSSSGMIEGGRDPRVSPLVMANPQSYVITGVIVSNSVKAAMIRTDFRENYVVRVGDRLGNQGGVIADIDMDGIVLKQPNGKIRIYVQSQSGQQLGGPNGGMTR